MALFSIPSRAVVKVSGEDARKLLNDTLTCRFDEGLERGGRWFALLSPQGKILVEGLVTHAEDAYWFDIDAALIADFIKRMKLYRLRAKADIEHLPQYTVMWSPDGQQPADRDFISYSDERGVGLGTRYIVEGSAAASHGAAVYEAARIAAGVSEFGADYGVNEVFPHDIGMDFLHGVDFKKGCYVGQEVVSRMQHRGTARRRPVIVSGLPDGAAAGASVMVGEREAGSIGAMRDGKAIAILRLDRVPDETAATFAGLPVTLSLPTWATYKFGESVPAD